MELKSYESPEMEIILIENIDVITSSGDPINPDIPVDTDPW